VGEKFPGEAGTPYQKTLKAKFYCGFLQVVS
jgi:hypothetical protein